jgi:HK97 family phage major capsid protein
MDVNTLDKASIEALGQALMGQMKLSLDKRDEDLCVKLGNAIDEKINAAIRDDERRRAQFAVAGLGKQETAKFQFSKLLYAAKTGDYSQCGYELEVINAGKAVGKDMTAGTDSAGGFLIPNEVLVNELIPLLKEQAVAAKLGAQMWTGLKNSPVQIPKKTAASTMYWVGETPTTITKSELAFGQIEMRPHTGAIRVGISNRLITQSGGAVEAFVRQDISEEMALGVDNVFFNGSGVSNEPRGLLQTSGINTVTSFGNAYDSTAYDKLIDMQYELRKDKVPGPFKWAMHPAVMREFQQMKDDATNIQPKSRRLFDSLPISTSLQGLPFESSMTIPTNDILLANWGFFGIGFWSTMSLRISDIPAWANLVTEILATIDIDIGIRRPEALCNTTGMTGATA